MDYEKKYNEALKWMRELYPGLHGATKEDAEHFFPELREGEDERIRKKLYNTVMGTPNDSTWFDGTSKEAMLAWLEKQKEQKPAVSREEILHQLFQNGSITLSDYQYLTGEQKPADDTAFEKWLDDWYQGSKEAGGCVVMSEKEFKNWSRGIRNMYQQKPAWSEEDESCWNLIWDILDGPFVASKESFKKAAAWFLKNCPKGTKSLRPSWKPSKEQMDALEKAIVRSCSHQYGVPLSELYEHLKRL